MNITKMTFSNFFPSSKQTISIYHSQFSLNWESLILVEFSLDLLLGNIQKSAATTWALISVDGECNALLQEFFDSIARHIGLVVGIKVSHNEDTTGSTDSVVSFRLETGLVYWVDLIAFIWIPSRADHTRTQRTSVVENDLSHYASSRFHWWECPKLIRLHINIVPDILGNGRSVCRCTTSLTVDSLVNWLELIRAWITNKHRVSWSTISCQHDTSIILTGKNRSTIRHFTRSIHRCWQFSKHIRSHLSVDWVVNQILLSGEHLF